jgi:putative glutamine amidotransferase
MKIGISKGSDSSPKYELYADWLRSADPNVECIDLSIVPLPRALEVLERCSGLVLTGGPDVHPERYGKAEELPRCSVEAARDEFESALYDKAKELSLPIIGVCRGAQLVNVLEGGSLIVDIPTDIRDAQHHIGENFSDTLHDISVESGSLLMKISGELDGETNSAHHQAVERLGEGLRISARSADGVVEAIEWQEPAGKAFFLGVQWHPERMNFANPFSGEIARHFLFEAESFKALFQKKHVASTVKQHA